MVEVAICRRWAKIDDGFDPRLIHTIRGVGYVLKRADDATRPTVAAPGPAGRRPRRAAGPGARRNGALEPRPRAGTRERENLQLKLEQIRHSLEDDLDLRSDPAVQAHALQDQLVAYSGLHLSILDSRSG